MAEATLQEFELLDAVSKGSQSETTASARSSIRSEKAVQIWINTSLALSFNNEKTGEPEVKKDPPDCPSQDNGEAVEDYNTDISRHSIPKNCLRAKRDQTGQQGTATASITKQRNHG